MTATSALKREILTHMAAGLKEGIRGFDPASGKFLAPNGGWAVTHQDRIYPLALLWATPGTAACRKRRLFDLACRGGDALRAMQDADGRWEFVKVDGSRWGKTYMPWSIYHWMEAYALLREALDPARRRRWEKGLTLACEGVARELAEPRTHNIPTWKGMALFRASQIFGRPDWADLGRRQVYFSTMHQDEAGFWPEGAGPTNGYNRVYIHALGLYYAFSRDGYVLEALERAARYHAVFTYPDGSGVETVDGRQLYHAEASILGAPGLSLFPAGRRLVRLAVGHLRRAKPDGGLGPHLASAFQHLAEGPEEPIACDRDGRTVHGRALVWRKAPWFVCVSGWNTPAESRPWVARDRWIRTRANTLSVWHDAAGLLIGGGHSKNDPQFATFDVWERGGHCLEPEAAEFVRGRGGEEIRFRYGRRECVLSLKVRDRRTLDLGFRAPRAGKGAAAITAGFTLRLPAGSEVRWTARASPPVDAVHAVDPLRSIGVAWTPPGTYSGRQLAGKGWRLRMADGSAFAYPAYPWNPYAIDNAAPAADAAGVVSVRLEDAGAREFRLTVG